MDGDQAVHPAFPAHSVILSNSPFLKAQCLRWLSNSSSAHSPSPSRGREGNIDADSSHIRDADSRRRIMIQLQDEQQVPAAMAVLAALYGVKPIPELLSELTHEQQLHAAVLADMWQIDAVSTGAAQLLMDAAQSPDGLSAATFRQLLSMAAHPDCLLPLLRVSLLSRLGDVQAVWSDAELQKLLLELPLAAMELLLESDELRATSEDNVLYTAQRYVGNISDPQEQQAAAQVLAPLIRCPHLSPFWLSASVLSDAAPSLLLNQLSKQVTKLVMVQQGDPGQPLVDPFKLVPGAPASWALGQRAGNSPSTVWVSWPLDISTLRQAAQDSARQQKLVRLYSPNVSPPIGGIAWGLVLDAEWQEDKQESLLSFWGGPWNVPAGMCVAYHYNIGVQGFFSRQGHKPLSGANGCLGMRNMFGLGPLPSGWDEVAWAAKGLPATGQLVLTLAVESVSHCS